MPPETVVQIVQIVMAISLIFFSSAYLVLKYNRKLHVILAILGVISNLTASIFLVYHVRFLGVVVESSFPAWVITTHRIVASLTAVLMLLMAYWGISKKLKWHRRFHLIFLVSYTIVFISGWILFVK